MEHPRVIGFDNHDPRFYPLIGPYLSRREVVREIGGPIWDDPGKTWWVALRSGKVAGFAATIDLGRKVRFVSAYTIPDQRRSGIYRALLAARLDANQGRTIRAVATPVSLPALLAAGFVIVRSRGSYTEVNNNG
jgi:hypothetical protein